MKGSLQNAKLAKNDEFYTRLSDVEAELKHYKKHFHDKVVLCNCDDPAQSAFWQYFHLSFEHLGLKKLIVTHYDQTKPTYKMEYYGGCDDDVTNGIITPLSGSGDFRSEECIELLKEADIVVTNPPFSLFREYVVQLMEYGKKFLIIGNINAITYKEVFPLVKENKVWLGYTKPKQFIRPDGSIKKLGNTCWFTNLDIQRKHEDLILWKEYDEVRFPCFENHEGINVDNTSEIPKDYDGVMGVPISFMHSYNPEQFDILDCYEAACSLTNLKKSRGKKFVAYKSRQIVVDGIPCQRVYHRIFIKRKDI